MNELRTILVGTDFSPCARAALRQGARIAGSTATLCVVHAISSSVVRDLAAALGRDAEDLAGEIAADARRDLEALVRTEAPDATVEVEVTVGQPLDVLLEAVDRRAADLLVVGVTGASGGHGVGSFALKCTRQARTRVLLVHEAHTNAYRRVVACVDLSDTTGRALHQAGRIAARDGAELRALHVYCGPWRTLHYRSPTPQASPAYQQQYRERLQGLLDDFVAEHAEVDCVAELYEHQSYGRGIVEYLKEHDADLAVLGTEGNVNLRYFFLGSTADRVLRETPCSVLTIKPAALATG